MAKCFRCNHSHSEYDKQCFEAIKSKCDCTPDLYLPKDNSNFEYVNLAYHQKALAQITDIHEKVEWLLEAVPGTRNQNNMEFIYTCWHFFTGFEFGNTWTKEAFEKIQKYAEPENIRRARQKVCHEELETLRMMQKDLRNLEKTEGKDSQAYWSYTERIKEFWKNTKYIPNDIAMLKKKQIKESAIFEYSILEIEDAHFSTEKRIVA